MATKLTLFTFVDAFGWEVYQRSPILTDLLTHAQPLKTTFGFSSGADPSILTGRYPDEHTHWSSFYYSPKNSPFKFLKYLSMLPSCIFERHRVRHWISKLMAKLYGYTGYFELYSVPFAHLPYFDYLEKRDYFVPGGILATDTIFDWCVEKNIPYHCANWRHSEEQILQCVKEEIEKKKIKFAYTYLPRLDGVMHNVGTSHKDVEQHLQWLEQQVTSLYQHAEKHYDEVALYLISDHGMTNVDHGTDLISRIKATGLHYGKDYVAMYDSTMARFWFQSDGSEAIIREVLSAETDGAIVDEKRLKEMRVYFEDHRFGELFFLMNPGVLIAPSYMGKKVIPGMHGFDPNDKDSYAMIAGNRAIDDSIKSITDIRKVMEYELLN